MLCLLRLLQLCNERCPTGGAFCQPVSAFQLRLADALVSDPRYFQSLETGELVQTCNPRGPGLLWNRTEVGGLGTDNPAAVSGEKG